ncbi:DinB family protein [Thalassospira lucentensis]|uniref:DinB family protein n=1 Tax=Thalassospira lucentensis TaxID=168935 RepID=UPI00142E679F|nr:DinB family protein [Thalassospira lucentensis]NIZ03669.1 damage-inducible protein DinB [Thalassospira lucentensis]
MPRMTFDDYGRVMARYNSWQNDALYTLCSEIGDEERRRDRGMFFGSIHATLNHLVHIDMRILDIMRTGEAPEYDAHTTVADDFVTLRNVRRDLDAEIEEFANSDDHDWQDGYREFTGVDGVTRKLPRPLFLIQFFNHQTHHRSQITSELHKMGIDYGITDVPLMPDVPL